MHDFGKSGWFILILFYNLIIFFDEGTKGSNAYGESSKGNDIENKDLLGNSVFILFLLCGFYAFNAIIVHRFGEWLIIQFAK